MTALVKRNEFSAEIIGQYERLSAMVSKTDFAPKSYRGNQAACLCAMLYGAEIGMGPMWALQNVAVINGKPALYGDGLLGMARRHPHFEGIVETLEGDGDGRTAVCVISRKGQPAIERRFSVGDAKRARLWDKAGPWSTYPERMLQMRARSWALRDSFADALQGIIQAEEAEDYEVDEAGKPKAYVRPPIDAGFYTPEDYGRGSPGKTKEAGAVLIEGEFSGPEDYGIDKPYGFEDLALASGLHEHGEAAEAEALKESVLATFVLASNTDELKAMAEKSKVLIDRLGDEYKAAVRKEYIERRAALLAAETTPENPANEGVIDG